MVIYGKQYRTERPALFFSFILPDTPAIFQLNIQYRYKKYHMLNSNDGDDNIGYRISFQKNIPC